MAKFLEGMAIKHEQFGIGFVVKREHKRKGKLGVEVLFPGLAPIVLVKPKSLTIIRWNPVIWNTLSKDLEIHNEL